MTSGHFGRRVVPCLAGIGLAFSVAIAATDRQTVGGRGQARAGSQKPPPAATDRRPVPPGRKVWDHSDETGIWLPWGLGCDPVQAPLQQAWEKQLKAVAELVRACPVFRDIRGYYPELHGCVLGPGGSGIGPYDASLALLIWPPVAVERTPKGELRVRDVWRYNGLGGLWININSFEDVTHEWSNHQDKHGTFHELPEARQDIQGFPLLGRVLYLSPPNKPPVYSPVTTERALRWIVDQLKGQVEADVSGLEAARRVYEEFISPAGQARRAKAIAEAEASQKRPENQALARRQAEAIDRRREQDLKADTLPKPNSPQAQTAARLAELEARLAAMTPEQRRRPAWYRKRPGEDRWPDYGEIVDADTAGARPLVVRNQDYFDLSLPKTAMQLVRTRVIQECVEGDAAPAIKGVCRAVVEQMDWRAVLAMLK